MFDQWVAVAYKHEQTKTASREIIDRLKLLPLDELIKAASGDPTSKLAFVDGPEDKQWIDKYKGTPLFEQAIGLEKELLQIDMQENEEHAARRAAEKEEQPRTNFYDMRDSLKLKQRMLDLELAQSQESASNPEAKEEQGAQLIEQAQAQEAAQGKGNEPHEQAETAALNQFRQAQQQEAAAEAPKTAARALNHREHVMRFYTDPGYRAECEKTAGSAVGTMLPETRSTGRIPADDRAQGAGAGNYTPEPSETVTGNIQVDKTAAVADTLKRYGQLVSGSKAKELGEAAKGWSRASNLASGDFAKRTAESAAKRVGGLAKTERLKSLGTQAATAAGAGAVAAGVHRSAHSEKTANVLTESAREHISKKNFALPKANGGKGAYPIENKSHAENALSRVDTFGSSSEKSKVHAAVAKAYPALAARSSVPDVAEKGHAALKKAAGIGDIATAAKGALGAGKSLVTNAFKSGGVPQVAKSLGNVAGGFAKAHPLATAGIAAGGGLLAGKMMSRQPQQPKMASVNLRGVAEGVRQLPLG